MTWIRFGLNGYDPEIPWAAELAGVTYKTECRLKFPGMN